MDGYPNAVASSSKVKLPPAPSEQPIPPAGQQQQAPLPPPSTSSSPLERALVKLDELFALEAAAQDHRSQSRRKAPSEAPGIAAACVECRARKAKCMGTAPGKLDCPRCLTRGLKCVWPELGVRGPKKGLTKKQRLLESIRMDIIRTMAEDEDDDDDSDSDGVGGSDDARTGYTASDTRASEGPVGGRPPCVPSPAKETTTLSSAPFLHRGPEADGAAPRMPPSSAHLLNSLPARQSSVSTTSTTFNDVQEKDLRAVLRNPLAVLATRHPLLESLAERRPPGPPTLAGGGYSQYYDGGLYQELPEADLSLDPVSLGLLTHDDLARLVALYFHRMRPFYWHLDPLLHTPEFLRLNSPFLTTAVAAVAATYDPQSHGLAANLQRHAEALAVRCFEVGCKSVEVIQAYGMLAHWASPGKSWSDDRSWCWQGQAMRIASDIRLDLPAQYENLAYYRGAHTLTIDDYRRMRDSREVTWTMLTRAEIYQGIQTGRVEAIVGLYLTGEPRPKLLLLPSGHPDYNYHASESCNRIVARAIHLWASLRDEYDETNPGEDSRLREKFKAGWQPQMDEWHRQWPDVDAYIRLFSEKILVVLNLISLRFPGGQSTLEVLHLCRSISIRSLQTIARWDETNSVVQVTYASNFILISIAFSAVFLLKLANLLDAGPTPELEMSCLHVVSLLERVGQFRSAGTSIASLHAERIRALLAKSRPEGQHPEPARTPVGRQEVVVPSFGPNDAFQGLSDDVLSFTWPESFTNSAIDFLDAASWDPQVAFGE